MSLPTPGTRLWVEHVTAFLCAPLPNLRQRSRAFALTARHKLYPPHLLLLSQPPTDAGGRCQAELPVPPETNAPPQCCTVLLLAHLLSGKRNSEAPRSAGKGTLTGFKRAASHVTGSASADFPHADVTWTLGTSGSPEQLQETLCVGARKPRLSSQRPLIYDPHRTMRSDVRRAPEPPSPLSSFLPADSARNRAQSLPACLLELLWRSGGGARSSCG